jgi:hypothetical protein
VLGPGSSYTFRVSEKSAIIGNSYKHARLLQASS